MITAVSPVAQPTPSPIVETVSPADEQGIIEIVCTAYRNRRAVYPRGGGTSLDYGAAPCSPGTHVSLASLNNVLDYAADDLTVTVQAGITLAELNLQLAARQQWLPVDPPEPAKATVGGIIATHASGPRRFGYGTVGDYLIGFRAIDGRGEVFHGGGKVVKNAAGYNLPRLMVGALGTLGVVTQATFMVRPLPSHAATVLCEAPTFRQAEALLASLGGMHATPALVEMFAGPERPHCPFPARSNGSVVRLAIGLEGSEAEVGHTAQTLLGQVAHLPGARQIDGLPHWLSDCRALLQINVLPGRVVETMEGVAEALPSHPLQAHAGNGVIRVFPPTAPEGRVADFHVLLRDKLRPLVAAAGGRLTVLAVPQGIELSPEEIWGPPRSAAGLMRAIQQRFDPAGILNPGRLWFGNGLSGGTS